MGLDIFKSVEEMSYSQLKKALQLHKDRVVEIEDYLEKREKEIDDQVEKYLHKSN